MATKMTANGVSTTTTPGTEQYEVFYTGYRTRRRKHYQRYGSLCILFRGFLLRCLLDLNRMS